MFYNIAPSAGGNVTCTT